MWFSSSSRATSFAPMAGYQTPLKLPSSSSVFTDCARLANSASSSGVVAGNASPGAIELAETVNGYDGTDALVTLLSVCGDSAGVAAGVGGGVAAGRLGPLGPLGAVLADCTKDAAGADG